MLPIVITKEELEGVTKYNLSINYSVVQSSNSLGAIDVDLAAKTTLLDQLAADLKIPSMYNAYNRLNVINMPDELLHVHEMLGEVLSDFETRYKYSSVVNTVGKPSVRLINSTKSSAINAQKSYPDPYGTVIEYTEPDVFDIMRSRKL